MSSHALAAASPAPETDGRRRRTQESRARIVAAMLELVEAGDISPSAEEVANRAKVGLRSVFRHFKDMDSLYAEMSAIIRVELESVAMAPFEAKDWRGRVIELVSRRGRAWERVAPFRRASDVHRMGSAAAQADRDYLNQASREILRRLLPAEIADDPLRFEALELLTSYEAWARLRDDQDLDVAATRATLEAAIDRVLG
jgi:AcrR family transcriptional regulator